MSPASFRSSRALALLGAVAVGSSLALGTVSIMGLVFGHSVGLGFLTACGAPPVMAAGMAWVALLRGDRLTGWLLGLPLAAASASATMMLVSPHRPTDDPGWLLGVGIWHLLATAVAMVLLGLPLAWSQRQARRGLAGAERGEVLVGVECVWLSCWALGVRAVVEQMRLKADPVVGLALDPHGQHAMLALALLGAVAGLGTTALALWRGRQRHALIASAESGARPDYRVEHTPAGRVLIRVRVAADDYRQADADEESFALEHDLADTPAAPRALV